MPRAGALFLLSVTVFAMNRHEKSVGTPLSPVSHEGSRPFRVAASQRGARPPRVATNAPTRFLTETSRQAAKSPREDQDKTRLFLSVSLVSFCGPPQKDTRDTKEPTLRLSGLA